MSIQQIVPVSGARLWTVQQGTGPGLVLCHGGPGLWDYLSPVAAMLSDLCTMYRYDQRACGRSDGGGPHTVERNIADLEGLREHWGRNEWIVGGHSWGATLALCYALTCPERASALIYISGTGVDPAWHAAYHAELDRRLGPDGIQRLKELRDNWQREGTLTAERAFCEWVWSTDFADPESGRQLARQLTIGRLRVNEEVNRELGGHGRRFVEQESIRQRLANLPVPTLVLHGAGDPRPAWAARQVAEALMNGVCVEMAGAGHFPWLEQPEAFRAHLRNFLSQIMATDWIRQDRF